MKTWLAKKGKHDYSRRWGFFVKSEKSGQVGRPKSNNYWLGFMDAMGVHERRITREAYFILRRTADL